MDFNIGDSVLIKEKQLRGTVTKKEKTAYVVSYKERDDAITREHFNPEDLLPYKGKSSSSYCVTDVPPEQLAYAMAGYSRSDKSLPDRLKYINENNTAKFLETNYITFGHASIADMGHIPMMVEDVSILAAIDVVDEPLWDGQERSTRYQDYSDSPYYIPQALIGTDEYDKYCAAMDYWFNKYKTVFDNELTKLKGEYPSVPDGLSERVYESKLRARAFDVARYYLPLGTLTSLGQITSERTLESQIARLAASDHHEIRDVAESMKQAALSPAWSPNGYKPALAPTLVKYVKPSPYRGEVARNVADFINIYCGGVVGGAIIEKMDVNLVVIKNPVVGALAKIVYANTNMPFSNAITLIEGMSETIIRGLLKDILLIKRGEFDDVLREFRGGELNFDIVMDIGGYRDLHRHRRTNQVRQNFTSLYGTFTYGHTKAERLPSEAKVHEPYTIPLGAACRSLFSMDLAQLIYLTELRTKQSGHWSYRYIAHKMYEQTVSKYPELRGLIRVTSPYEDNIFAR